MGSSSSKGAAADATGPRYINIVRTERLAPAEVPQLEQQQQQQATAAAVESNKDAAKENTGSGGCPMNKFGLGGKAKAAPDAASGCPMSANAQSGSSSSVKYMNPSQYNVYGQKIDPANNMPVVPAQHKAPAQSSELSTTRVPSTIPKGGSADTWTYPSPQMFWNALTRKGKVEDTTEADMDSVVSVHNTMNEKTWQQIRMWEEVDGVDPGDGTGPRLLRFQGRPDDLSPKAWLRTLFGYAKPFDRHDWVVDRAGRERRYVIDYYYSEAAAAEPQTDNSKVTAVVPKQRLDGSSVSSLSSGDTKSIIVDVRPALDSFDSFIFRCMKMPAFRKFAMTPFTPLPFFLPASFKASAAAAGESPGSSTALVQRQLQKTPQATAAEQQASAEEQELAVLMQQMQDKCRFRLEAVKNCDSEDSCTAASIALTHCMGSVACKDEATVFAALSSDRPGDAEGAFEAMQQCLEKVEARARAVKRSDR